MAEHHDDSEMSRFERDGLMRGNAAEAVLAITVVALILVIFAGGAVLEAGEESEPGVSRDVLTAVGKVTDRAADGLPLESANKKLTTALSPDEDLVEEGGFGSLDGAGTEGGGEVPGAVTAAAFDPAELGQPVEKARLERLLVTGDSLSQPLDAELAQLLVDDGVEVIREPRPGSGISNDVLVDWGRLSATLAERDRPQAVIVFIGANEGYPLPGPDGAQIECCGPDWAAAFATRVRRMIDNFRAGDGEATRIYWLLVPAARNSARGPITDAVNSAIEVAAQPWRDQVRLVDLESVFTPEGRYRAAMEIDGTERIVRESDGIHLNQVGSALAAELVLDRLDLDFER